MIVRFVMLRTKLTERERDLLKWDYYQAGWPRDKTIFVFDPSDPESGDAHLANLQHCRDAGEEVVVILAREPLPAKAMRAGFPHVVVLQRPGDPMSVEKITAVRPEFDVFLPEPPPAA